MADKLKCDNGCGQDGVRLIHIGGQTAKWLCYPCGNAKLRNEGIDMEALKPKG